MRLKGKNVAITAAAQGIGRASALACVAEGAKVFATDIDEAKLAELAAQNPSIHVQRLDVTNAGAVADYAKSLPALDGLFNCAGFVHNGAILDCGEKDWDFSFDLNVKSMYRLISGVLPGMLDVCAEKGTASILNMASMASSIKGFPNRFVYGASKAAVVGLTKAVAADFVQKGIRCNAIAPGTVDTPSLAERINAYPDPVEARRMFVARQPMGRLAKAEEIAPVVVFLASDESAFATGNVYSVDGGMTI